MATTRVLTLLQSDLRSLCVESRRRHPNLKETAESVVRRVRELQSLPCLEIDALEFSTIVQPFKLACATEDPKLRLIAVNCLQKCISTDAVPPESMQSILDILHEQSTGGSRKVGAHGSEEAAQAKALQTLLALLASSRYTIRCAEVGRALSICFLHASPGVSSSAVVRSTALGTLRQSVGLLVERAGSSYVDAGASSACEGVAETDCVLRCVFFLLQDLCTFAAAGNEANQIDGKTTWIAVHSVERHILLELVEVAAAACIRPFAQEPSMLRLMREELCPLLLNLLSPVDLSFKLLYQTVRIIWALATHFSSFMRSEYAMLLTKLTSLLPVRIEENPPKIPHRFKNQTPLWQRTLVMEVYSLIFADHEMLREWHSYGDHSPSQSTYTTLVDTLLAMVEYGLLCDKVFPSPPGSLRRVSLEASAEAAPNDSAGYVLSLAIGSMIDLGQAICEPFDDGQPDVAQTRLVDVTWTPLLQMLALVLLRCNQTEMVQAALAVYSQLVKATTSGGPPLKAARDAVLCSLARFCLTRSDCDYLSVDCSAVAMYEQTTSFSSIETAGKPRLSLKNVAVIVALFDCAHELFAEALCAPPWLMLLQLLDDIDCALGAQPHPNSSRHKIEPLLSHKHLETINTSTARFFADSAALIGTHFSDLITALSMLLKEKIAKDALQPDRVLRLSVGDASAGDRCFLITSLTCLFKYNLRRIWCSWNTVVGVLQAVAGNVHQHLANLGINALLNVVTHALSTEDEDQQRILGSLTFLSKSTCAETNERVLRGLYILMESAGHKFQNGWGTVLSIIQHSSNSNASKVVNVAFESVQLIITDFLPCMPVEFIQPCILTVSNFRARHCSVNISLTAIGHLWHIADWVGGVQGSLIVDFKRLSDSGQDPVPTLVHDVSSLDGGAMAPHDDGTSFAMPLPPSQTSSTPHMERLWRTIFHQMQRGTDDPRPEVRKCAVQTLFSTLASHGNLFGRQQWHECLWQLVFPVLATVHAASLTARDAAIRNDDTQDPVALASGQRQVVPMLIHHSRNTLSKQWDETKALALAGATGIFCEYLSPICDLDSCVMAWKLLLEFNEASLLLGSEEVLLAGIDVLNELLAVCCPVYTRPGVGRQDTLVSDADTACKSVMVQEFKEDLWRHVVAMLHDAVMQLTAGPSSQRREDSWVLMPMEPALSSKSLHRLIECVARVDIGKWAGGGNSPAHTMQHLLTFAASIDLLLHGTFKFDQPLSVLDFAGNSGQAPSVQVLQPGQELALAWMQRQLELWDSIITRDPTSVKNTSSPTDFGTELAQRGTNLLLLQCLRYLPNGAKVIAESGGHSILMEAAPTVSGTDCLPLAQAALQIFLRFFHTGYDLHLKRQIKVGADKSSVNCASMFLFAVRIFGQCAENAGQDAEESRSAPWATFRSGCRQGVIQLVRLGLAVNARAADGLAVAGAASNAECDTTELALICEELATLGGRYLAPGHLSDSAQALDIEVDIADCIVSVLRCSSFQHGQALSESTTLRLLRVLDTGAEHHSTAAISPSCNRGHGDAAREAVASRCFCALFELGEPCQANSASISQLVAPILFNRCEAILRRYLEYHRHAGPRGLPAPRWQRDELLRLLCALCKLPLETHELEISVSNAEDASGWRHLLIRLLPRLCEVIALGASTNGQAQPQLALAMRMGFASLSLPLS